MSDNQKAFSNAYIPPAFEGRIFAIPSRDFPFAVFFGYVTNVKDNGFMNAKVTPPVDLWDRTYPLSPVMVSMSILSHQDIQWYTVDEIPVETLQPNTLPKPDKD